VSSERPDLTPILRAPIHFEAQDGERVHAPMVPATIGAIHTRLVLDTGSDVHLVTRELAEAARLPLAGVDVGTDHAGTEMDSWLVGDISITLDVATGPAEVARSSQALKLHDVVAIPAPAAFIAQGIGGILSPQRLHDSAYAVIDEIEDELLLVDVGPAQLRDWLLDRRRTPDVLVIERRSGDHRPIVVAAIEPHPSVEVLVNTGGRHTEFEPSTVAGLAAGALERIGTGVSGVDVLGADAGRQVLALAGARVALPALKLRAGMADPAAMIGQDVIRGTIVAIGPDPATPVLWQVEELGEAASEPAAAV
jgi:hypothetical protein